MPSQPKEAKMSGGHAVSSNDDPADLNGRSPPFVLKRRLWRRYRAGYEVWIENFPGMPDDFEIKFAYTPNGALIGNSKTAHRLCKQRGIAPEPMTPEGKNCSIGFCEREQKWHGWSHRAMHGFGAGDVVEEGDCTASSLPVGFTAKTLDDARKMAVAFAECVS